GLQAAVQLVASGGGLQPPGGSLSLLCKASGFDFGSFVMGWARWTNRMLQLVATISPDGAATSYGPGVRGRAAVSRDNVRKLLELQLERLEAGDGAIYYC
ncbi:HV374 protein, partial [Rhinopomastus cyanomelas]|nr:HV374 protein [Rhinopomastus cyanomelas]